MKILNISKTEKSELIAAALSALQVSGMIVYPTETCYGLGVDATNQTAVDKLLQYKDRKEGSPLSIAVSDQKMASKYADLNDIAKNLYKNYLPGPITVISKGLGKVAKGIESEYGTLGIRIPDYPLLLEIIKQFGKPITTTSANVSYKPRPYSIEQLLSDLPDKQESMLDLILDAGKLPKNKPSTVVDTTLNDLNILREGSLQFDKDLEDDRLIDSAKTKNAEETTRFGSTLQLINQSRQPIVLALRGEMGAGKTQFVKGIAQSLGITETVSSPTFTIIDEYKSDGVELIHVDTWRLADKLEFTRSGIERYFKKNSVIAIEWADKFYDELIQLAKKHNARVIKVDFEYLSETERSIKVYEAKNSA